MMLNFSGELTFGRRIETFEVPEGTTAISLRGTTVKKGFLYAYLFDANQHLRAGILWMKPEKDVVITHDSASLGGLAGELPAGTWSLHLYNLEGEDRCHKPMQYQADIRFDVAPVMMGLPTVPNLQPDNRIAFDYSALKKPASGWYKGDLHAHTLLSDGHNTLEAAAAIIETQELDFMFLTEHNLCHPALPDSEHTLILPGVEITTDKGHFNVHGPCRGLAMFEAKHASADLIEQGIAMAGKNIPGASSHLGNISINHPMMKPWHWQYADMPLAQVDTMEICCDPTWSTSPASTEQALEVLTAMWQCGQRIYGVGGSDSHLEPHERNPKATAPSIYGDPATYVFSHGLSGEGILAGLRNGHVYLERQCGLVVSINLGSVNLGSVLPGQDVGDSVVHFQLTVKDKVNDYYAEFIADGDVIARQALQPEGSGLKTEVEVEMARYHWLRVDIRRGTVPSDTQLSRGERGEFEGLINPVFNGQHVIFAEPVVTTWGELMASDSMAAIKQANHLATQQSTQSKQQKVKGVLFDKDGTLLEFHHMWLKVAQGVVNALLAAYPARSDITDEKIDAETDDASSDVTAQSLLTAIGVFGERVDNHGLLASNPVEDTADAWYAMLQPSCSRDAFTCQVKTLFNQQVEAQPELIQALPGIEESLIKLKQMGYKLGIATADTKAATLYSLEQSGLLGLFDFIGYSDGDIAPKPAPALMNAFCAHCDLTPDQVVMFGDTVSDMVFGRNAGARRIGVLTGTATEEELRPYADFVLHSVADFSPSLLETA